MSQGRDKPRISKLIDVPPLRRWRRDVRLEERRVPEGRTLPQPVLEALYGANVTGATQERQMGINGERRERS
jgi:hypothetical protein